MLDNCTSYEQQNRTSNSFPTYNQGKQLKLDLINSLNTQNNNYQNNETPKSSNYIPPMFDNRYSNRLNASPESAMSPGLSSVATSTSEVSYI